MENTYQENKNNYINLVGGTIRTSKTYDILNSLTPANKIINKFTTNQIISDGHKNAGAIFIGSFSSEPEKIRILCGKETRFAGAGAGVGVGVGAGGRFKYVLNAFGGKIDAGESILVGMIRETIEEIFNFRPSRTLILLIQNYLTDPALGLDSYQIIESFSNSYTYIFDVSTLGNFIEQMQKDGIHTFDPYILRGSFIPGCKASVPDYKFTNFNAGISLTINLQKFMQERQIPKSIPDRGLNEYHVIGFPLLHNIYTLKSPYIYDFYNEVTRKRELLRTTNVIGKIVHHPAIAPFI